MSNDCDRVLPLEGMREEYDRLKPLVKASHQYLVKDLFALVEKQKKELENKPKEGNG